MKPWSYRAATGIAAGIAAITVPLTATSASATPPPGSGWHVSGGLKYHSKAWCEIIEKRALLDMNSPYQEVWCDGPGGYAEYKIWVR
ncbi:hypothetical protein [Streptomyces parvulus]|uniref:hypothetical protein n=1 Tax=Streptomyces parvulus TaxID=146923 RepID=UPI0034143871